LTALIIISAIILVFAFLLNMKIKAEINYLGGKFSFSVKYLGFTIFSIKKKKKKVKKAKKNKNAESENLSDNLHTEAVDQNQKSESSATDNVTEPQTERTDDVTPKSKEPISQKIDKLFEIIEKVKIIWSVSKKHLIKIFRHIYIEEFMIDFTIADEDAYTAAMNYGKINAAVYNIINFIRTFFSVTIKTVDIICDFDSKKSVYDFSTKITVKPSTILSAAFGILFGLLINLKKLIGKNNMKQISDKKAVSM